jgi:predicted nucleotidyltransferase
MKREEVIKILTKQRTNLAEHFAVSSLALFGSVARDQATPGSDVDLLVEFSKPIGLLDFISLKQHLETLLDCPVDLGTARSLKTRLKEDVLREVIYVN